MKLDHAIAEPYVRFSNFRDYFDRNMRVTFGGLEVLREKAITQDGNEAPVEVPAGDEPWGPPRQWRNIGQLTKIASHFLSHTGLVRVMSGFEDFLGNVVAEHGRFAALAGGANVGTEGGSEFKEGDSLRAFLARMRWVVSGLSPLMPFYDYFSLIRNCVVHRDGRASSGLVDFGTGQQFVDAIDQWNSVASTPLLPFPLLTVNREIAALPRHAVLASIVCNRIAHLVNEKLVTTLQADGLVYMATWHTLLAPEVIAPFVGRCGSTQRLIKRTLVERYRVQDLEEDEVIQSLRGMNKWAVAYRRFIASPYWATRVKRRWRQ